MSQTNTTEEKKPNADHPAMENVDTTPNNTESHEWAYSGKAMRAQCILYWVITFLVLAGTCYLTMIGKQIPDSGFRITWIGVVIVLIALWIQFYSAYFYRTWTIRYKLTEHRLDSYQGLFTKTRDTTELLYIDDLRLVITLWDRVFNGGVGKIIIFSSADKTDHKLELKGIENPQDLFDRIDSARARVRAKRGFITS